MVDHNYNKLYKINLIIFSTIIIITGPLFSQDFEKKLTIYSSETHPLYKTIETRLNKVINSLNDIDKSEIRILFRKDAFRNFKELIDSTSLYFTDVYYNVNMIEIPEGGFEVRDIRVRIGRQDFEDDLDQYLVFTLDPDGYILDVRFAIETHQYHTIINDGKRLDDLALRHKILQFVEIFRTAYCRKDLGFIEKAFSEDALIIVGRKLKSTPAQSDIWKQSLLSRERIAFIRRDKVTYINKLKEAFEKNAFIEVNFDKIEITRHNLIPNIYGVTLKQRWRSSSYSDEGYLFLMIDFEDENRPLIHVRAWQPQPWLDGTIINLYDFVLIE